ncbi:hypothetical protein WN943_029357 [Citrus x changshan-huyou]
MTNDENNTALHEAVCHGNVQVVKIRTGQDPDYPYSANNYGKTQLYLAAKGRYSEMVIELLENSTSVSYEGPNGKTALHAAAMHFYYVRYDTGGNYGAVNKKNASVIDMLIYGSGELKFVGEILEICPSLQTQVNGEGDTPLPVAAKFGHFNIANVLIKREKLAQHEDEELESGLRATRQMIRMTNENKNTALHCTRQCFMAKWMW